MEQRHSTHIHQHKISRAWNGDSILALPVDNLLLRKGAYATFDNRDYTPAPQKLPQGAQNVPPKDQGSREKDNAVVLEALQRILRKKEDKPNKPFSEFGQARPIR